jgi:hypothetical protein
MLSSIFPEAVQMQRDWQQPFTSSLQESKGHQFPFYVLDVCSPLMYAFQKVEGLLYFRSTKFIFTTSLKSHQKTPRCATSDGYAGDDLDDAAKQ